MIKYTEHTNRTGVSSLTYIKHRQFSETIAQVYFNDLYLYFKHQCIVAFQYRDEAWVCENIKHTDEYEILLLNVHGMLSCGLIDFCNKLDTALLEAKQNLFEDISDDEVIDLYMHRVNRQMQRAA